MNKSELIDYIAESADMSKAAAGRALDATVEAVKMAMKKGRWLRWSVLARFTWANAPPEPDATRRPALRSGSTRPRCLNSERAKA
jgi:Bacterial nucleoid DNA-binding protein